MVRSGAELVIEALKAEGVEVVFGFPGGVVIPLFDKLYAEPSLRVVLTRHEQGAVHAADGYARSTGKVGVCLVTSGPGATNTVTGLATANFDSVPLVVITGQVSRNMIGNDAFQEADIVGISRSVTKHNYLVTDRRDLGRILREAFHIAASGRPGPVLVDIPKDVLLETSDLPLPATSPAKLTIRTELQTLTATPQSGIVKGTIGAIAFQQLVSLAPNEQKTIAFTPESYPVLSIDAPKLWWPNGYGAPDLYTLNLVVHMKDASISRGWRAIIALPAGRQTR